MLTRAPETVMLQRSMSSMIRQHRHRGALAAAMLLLAIASTPTQAGWRDRFGDTGRKAVETFGDWRDRMFSVIRDDQPLGPEGSEFPIVPTMNVPERFVVSRLSPKQAFPQGESHYRMFELSRDFEHIAIRVRVMAVPREQGRGNSVFQPILYVLDDVDQIRESKQVEPLLLDIQPFKRTRLLACSTLDNVRRFIVATPVAAVGQHYETASRSKLKAPKTSYGFHYSTDSVKVKLPYAATGEMVLEVTEETRQGAGCAQVNGASKQDTNGDDSPKKDE